MPYHSFSPAASENEYDISRALLPTLDSSDESTRGEDAEDRNKKTLRPPAAVPSRQVKNGPDTLEDWAGLEEPDIAGLGSDDDDGNFIAAQQAASNRKASNLKGRTVRKGGGFQAMGMLNLCTNFSPLKFAASS